MHTAAHIGRDGARMHWAQLCLRFVIAVAFGAGAGVFAALSSHTAAAAPLGRSSTTFAPTPSGSDAVLPVVAPSAPSTTTTTTIVAAVPPAPRVSAPAAPTAAAPQPATMTVQQRGEAALRRLSYPYQQLGYTISFLPGAPGYFGRGFHEQRRIEVYVRNSQSDADLAHVVAHEIGHAVDWVYHNDARDRQWLTLRGVDPATSWAPCSFCPDFGAPSGDFAEVFALWQLGSTDFRSTLAGPPTPAQLQQLSRLFYP